MKLWIRNAKQVVRVVATGEACLRGVKQSQADLAIFTEKDGVGVSILVDKNGKISAVDYDDVITKMVTVSDVDEVLDATGMCILPGFVDAHTHPVWAGDRVHEFVLKMSGATYMEVHAAGGGIHFTVNKTREASEDELYKLLEGRLYKMLRNGTVLVEAKSGYGLDTVTEMKMLRVIKKAKQSLPISISRLFAELMQYPRISASEAAKLVIEEQLTEVVRAMKNEEIDVDSIDVFCEKGVYEIDESRAILAAGREAGLRLNFHADELSPIGGAEMGAEMKVEAMSHLEEISPEGIKKMEEAGSVAVLLPTTVVALRLRPPPAREMIQGGVAVALGTDFNPNAHCLSMPMVMHLACSVLGMSPVEALIGATINSAAALGYEKSHGSLEVGKSGDMVIIDAPRWEHVIYQFGGERDVIRNVITRGQVVYTRKEDDGFQKSL